jgi:hypothetical protein
MNHRAAAVLFLKGGGAMAYYRLYFFGCGNRIEQFREFEVSNDLAAIRQAAEWRGTVAMELWSGARKVRRWDQSDSPRRMD